MDSHKKLNKSPQRIVLALQCCKQRDIIVHMPASIFANESSDGNFDVIRNGGGDPSSGKCPKRPIDQSLVAKLDVDGPFSECTDASQHGHGAFAAAADKSHDILQQSLSDQRRRINESPRMQALLQRVREKMCFSVQLQM